MSSVSAIALSGMNVATLRLQASAYNIANSASDDFVPQQVVQVDAAPGTAGALQSILPPLMQTDPWTFATNPYARLTTEMVQQLVARFDLTANAQVFRADARMQAALLYAAG